MTRYRLEHAVVMDTDDIPGRGGYAVVGISRGVSQAERLFVAQNFGLSDFLHDPQNDRTFYSFFRVPGGRRAFTRRFANGRRRNGTQNRLFVHTLFFEDALFEGLAGLPWLLLEGTVRAEGTNGEFQPLRNEVPWVGLDGSLSALDVDIDDAVASDVPRRLNARLALAGKDVANASESAAAVIGALRDQKRVVLPQGRGYEWLTLLAWSMLPPRDREELAWTHHDTLNLAGVTFHVANVANPAAEGAAAVALDRPAAPVATRIVRLNTGEAGPWREFHERAARYGLTIRKAEVLEACLAHREAIRDITENIGAPEQELIDKLTALARTGDRLRGQACFEGEGILELLWNNIPRAVAAQQPAGIAVTRWASLLHRSGLDEVVFRDAPGRSWLDRAAADVGPDLVVDFFLRCTEDVRDAVPARGAVAEWVAANGARGVENERLARLVVRAYADRAASRRPLLERLLATGDGLPALQQAIPARAELAELVYDAIALSVNGSHEQVRSFARDVLVPYVELSAALAGKITRELAERIAPLLRDDVDPFLRFQARLASDTRVRLTEMVTGWVTAEPERTLPLAREVMRQLSRDSAAAVAAGPLALAMAHGGEPARVWFAVLLNLARTLDAKDDAAAAKPFLDSVRRLQQRSMQMQGAFELVVEVLDEPNVRIGPSVRALLLLVRPGWQPHLLGIVEKLVGRTYSGVAGWADVVTALAADFAGTPLRAEVSELVSQFWQKVPPEDVAAVPRSAVEAIAHVSGTSRRRLADVWQPRLRRLPESDAARQLLAMLFGDGESVRAQMAWREIEQGIAGEGTLNRLDAALYQQQGAKYAPEMATAIVKFLGDAGRIARLRKLCALLRSPKVLPTVKRIIEVTVLPPALQALGEADWSELTTKARDEELLCRGPATLTIAFQLGANGDDSAVRQFESACRAHKRGDVVESLIAGRRSRGLGRRVSRWLGIERQPTA